MANSWNRRRFSSVIAVVTALVLVLGLTGPITEVIAVGEGTFTETTAGFV